MADDSAYRSTAYYRMMYGDRSNDLPFYIQLVTASGGEVLEYGVGYGRVALPAARAGATITGVDNSGPMISQLKENLREESPEVQQRVRTEFGDARTLQLGRRFELVMCPFNGIAHHHTQPQIAAFLERVREHLDADGLFAFDTLIPDPKLLAGTSSEVSWLRHPETGMVSRATESVTYDEVTQVLTISMEIRSMSGDRPPDVYKLELRQFFPQETMLMLDHYGFDILRRVNLGDVMGYVCSARS